MENHLPHHTPPAATLNGLKAGFPDPVMQAQRVFRHLLTALAEPGTLHQVSPMTSPGRVHEASYQICLALLDAETSLWIAPDLRSSSLETSLRFHCGCPLAKSPAQADFALVTMASAGQLTGYCEGSHEYPDRSTTVIVQTDGLKTGGPLRLTGPGIDGGRQVTISGLDDHWLEVLSDNRVAFPLGVDLLFTSGSTLMGLPRTTRVESVSCM